MRDATLVTTQAQLDTAVFRLESAARLAIDTEFMRERTYYPQLCLVQVATDSDCELTTANASSAISFLPVSGSKRNTLTSGAKSERRGVTAAA